MPQPPHRLAAKEAPIRPSLPADLGRRGLPGRTHTEREEGVSRTRRGAERADPCNCAPTTSLAVGRSPPAPVRVRRSARRLLRVSARLSSSAASLATSAAPSYLVTGLRDPAGRTPLGATIGVRPRHLAVSRWASSACQAPRSPPASLRRSPLSPPLGSGASCRPHPPSATSLSASSSLGPWPSPT